MSKKRAIMIGVAHFIWTAGLCLIAYYLEYLLMGPLVQFGVIPVVAGNMALGIILFLAFYMLEKKMLKENLTKKILFCLATYVIPFAYQWIIMAQLMHIPNPDENINMISIVYAFACLYTAIIACTRAIMEFLLFIHNKREQQSRLI